VPTFSRRLVFATIAAANTVETQLSLNFANLAPVLLEQLGLQVEEGEREAARVIDEAVLSYQPLVAYFIGVDTDPIRAALKENVEGADFAEDTSIYLGIGEGDERPANRAIVVSDNWERGVVAVQAANYPGEQFTPVAYRLAGFDDQSPPATEIESVQWCLDQLVDAPVVTGEINGARRKFGENPHANRGIEPIEPFDTLLFGMDVSEYAGTVQAIVSDVDGEAPEADALGEAFAEPTGEYKTRYHPNVSTMVGSW